MDVADARHVQIVRRHARRRGDGPHREAEFLDRRLQRGAIVETLLGVQFYSPDNPRPYDDTGWAIPLLRNVKATAVADKSILSQPMTLASADLAVPGTIAGTGPVVIVDNTTDNTLMTFRFTHASVKMTAAEQP